MSEPIMQNVIAKIIPEANLMQYEAMCFAISKCHSVDEAKEIHDKAIAIEVYARQANNMDAEIKAKEIRLRAERRTGELLKDLQKSKGGRPSNNSSDSPKSFDKSQYAETLERTGMTSDKAARYQKLADVPEEQFEAALADTTKPPSANAILIAANGSTKMDTRSLDVWGKIEDFESDGVFEMDPAEIYGGMTDVMQEDIQRVIEPLLNWLTKLREVAANPSTKTKCPACDGEGCQHCERRGGE